MKSTSIILFSLLFFFSLTNLTSAQEEDTQITKQINIPIIKDGYLKEKWSTDYVWHKGYLSLGFNTTTYKEARSRILIEYDLSVLKELGLGIGDIESGKLNLHHYHTERDAPAQFEVQINDVGNLYPTYTSWPAHPEIDNNTLEVILPKKGGVRDIDITPIIKKQLAEDKHKNTIQISATDEKKLGVLYYSTRCMSAFLFYKPYCDDTQIPSIVINSHSHPPERPVINEPLIEISEPSIINLRWEGSSELFYTIELSKAEDFSELLVVEETDGNNYPYEMSEEGEIYWRVIASRSSDSNLISKSDVGVVILSLSKNQARQNKDQKKAQKHPIHHPPNKDVMGETIKEDKVEDESKDIDEEDKDHKNVALRCIKYYTIKGKVLSIECTKIGRFIRQIRSKWIGEKLQLDIKKAVPKGIQIKKLPNYCKQKLWKPHSCQVKYYYEEAIYQIDVEIDGKYVPTRKKNFSEAGFLEFEAVAEKESITGIKVYLYILHPLNPKTLIGIQEVALSKRKILRDKVESKPFRFPFSRTIGVTQWHGYTDFTSPHTGIDFAARGEMIFSLADGEVAAKGYDDYYGKCNSGGNFLTIKHEQSKHTVFFHLAADSIPFEKGDKVSKGDYIGKTGNSGSYNCQPIAHHLHLETRNDTAQSTHKDPVTLIDYNWDEVLTVGHDRFPGRLSGNNPHPGR